MLVIFLRGSILSIVKKETLQERKERFKAMSSLQRKELIRAKLKKEGLQEGSGVLGVSYEEDEVRDLIQITNCFPELQNKRSEPTSL